MDSKATIRTPVIDIRQVLAGAMRLGGGAVLGHGITMACMPLLARFYGPEAFGVWAGWLALAVLLGSVACLRYELAIALPEGDRDALAVAALAILLSLACGAIGGGLMIALWAFKVPGPWQRVGGYVFLIPAGAWMISWVSVVTQWLARINEAGILAKAKIWSCGATAVVQLTLGWLGGAVGLIFGDVVGRGAGLWGRVMGVWQEQALAIASIKREDLREALHRYRHHSAWMTPTALIEVLGQQAPLLLMISWYGDGPGGKFSLAQRLLALPIALMGQAVAQLFLPAMARSHAASPRAALRLFLNLSGLLTLFGVALIGFMWYADEAWLIAVLGVEWLGIGRFLMPLALLTAVQLVVSTLSTTAIVLNVQKWFACWIALRMGAVVWGMWIGHNQAGEEGAVWGLAAASSTFYVLLWLGLLTRLFQVQWKTSYP